ncbi:MAG: DNA alkylation repair protein [Flavobacterium sp.]|nr:DNA alkylation repair protein [Flavobacterium sp.]
MPFIPELLAAYEQQHNPDRAHQMEAYLKYHFKFYGIQSTPRRATFKALFDKHKTEIAQDFRTIAWELFSQPQRELHYCGIEILQKLLPKNWQKSDLVLIEKFLVTNSWWDSVDTIAKYLLGGYLQHFQAETYTVIERYSNSSNLWLNRSAIIFQLGYKTNTNGDLLFAECLKHAHSKEFFIQKSIGWALREYHRCNPIAVEEFVATNTLKPLSKKEALKHVAC